MTAYSGKKKKERQFKIKEELFTKTNAHITLEVGRSLSIITLMIFFSAIFNQAEWSRL